MSVDVNEELICISCLSLCVLHVRLNLSLQVDLNEVMYWATARVKITYWCYIEYFLLHFHIYKMDTYFQREFLK